MTMSAGGFRITEGVTVSMDIEQIIYETDRFQEAVSLLKLSREFQENRE
jgi:hypothetical protein